jgi:hypothetical protein
MLWGAGASLVAPFQEAFKRSTPREALGSRVMTRRKDISKKSLSDRSHPKTASRSPFLWVLHDRMMRGVFGIRQASEASTFSFTCQPS